MAWICYLIMSEHSNPDSVYSPHRTRAPISLTILFIEPQYTEKQPRFLQNHGLDAKFKIHKSRLFKLRWHSAILRLEAFSRSMSRSEALRCYVLCNRALVHPLLSFTLHLCLWQTLQVIQDTFYRYACPLGNEHMTPVLLGLRSTSSATGSTVGIFGLCYREFASIAIMRNKKILSL